MYSDSVVTAYIAQLGQHLVNHSQRQDITYHFKVVNTEAVNAFAVPGGYLYVNIGLIRAAESESELAGVIGHEIGHVVAQTRREAADPTTRACSRDTVGSRRGPK